jgi:CheY-like chemotaxis protein
MARILVVDDDIDIGTATAMILREDGHEVDICTELDDAKARISKQPPDLAVVDVMFPGNMAGGFELARHMAKAAGATRRIPVILLSSINKEYQLGFNSADVDEEWMPVAEFMEKPVEFEALKKKVRELLAAA